ncbi:MAG: hypothetical protein ACLFTA_01900 [Candidatus Nanohaloarchaea archaeon]
MSQDQIYSLLSRDVEAFSSELGKSIPIFSTAVGYTAGRIDSADMTPAEIKENMPEYSFEDVVLNPFELGYGLGLEREAERLDTGDFL